MNTIVDHLSISKTTIELIFNRLLVGAPIPVEKIAQPTKEQLDDLHARYVDAVVEMFYKYREKYALDPNDVIAIV
jgi:hypothetical protein